MAGKGWGAITSLFIQKTDEEPVPSMVEPDPEPEPEPVAAPVRRSAIARSVVASASLMSADTSGSSDGSPEIPEGRPFDELYRDAGVPASPYPVEKLLTVLTGLAAMPEAQIRMCVTAMDAADESWTIEDPVADARNKIDALKNEKARLAEVVAEVDAQGKADIIAADTHLAETAASIKAQIDALQAELHAKMDLTSAAKAAIDAGVRAAREAAARESLRLESEVGRLNRIPNTFGTGLPSATPTR
jgi:hypothetical protein